MRQGGWGLDSPRWFDFHRVHRRPHDSTLLTPDGDLVMAYGWGVRAGYDQYTTEPFESVILARRLGTPCDTFAP